MVICGIVEKVKTTKQKEDPKMTSYLSMMHKNLVGVTDDWTKCDCCGKENLKRTVVFEVKDEYVMDLGAYYQFLGTTCATKVGLRANTRNAKKVSPSTYRTVSVHRTALLSTGEEDTIHLSYVNGQYKFRSSKMTESLDLLTRVAINKFSSKGEWEGQVEEFEAILQREEELYYGRKVEVYCTDNNVLPTDRPFNAIARLKPTYIKGVPSNVRFYEIDGEKYDEALFVEF